MSTLQLFEKVGEGRKGALYSTKAASAAGAGADAGADENREDDGDGVVAVTRRRRWGAAIANLLAPPDVPAVDPDAWLAEE